MNNEFDCETIYSSKILKTKIKPYGDKARDFKKILKVGSSYTCLAVILIDFVLKKDKIYYLQMLLNECK